MKCAYVYYRDSIDPSNDYAMRVCGKHRYAHPDIGHEFEAPHDDAKLLSRAREGEGNPRSILTVAQVDEILTTRVSAGTLAKKFGVTHSAVCRIRQGRNWSHYTPVGCLYRKGGRDGTGLRRKVRAKKLPPDAPRLKRP